MPKPDPITHAGLLTTYGLALAACGVLAAGEPFAASAVFLAALATIAIVDWRHNRQE
jgi:hypothetical protein